MESLKLVRLTSPDHELWAWAMQLYDESFPQHERRSHADTLRAFEHPDFRAEVALDEHRPVGIIYYWLAGEFLYGEYLAIDTSLRGKRYGSRILSTLIEHHPNFLLEIEPPIDDYTRGRESFYHKLGFRTNPQPYRHESYTIPFHPHPLVIMSHGRLLEQSEFDSLCRYVKEVVMLYSDHHPELK